MTRVQDLGQELGRLSRTLHQVRAHVASESPDGVPWSTFTLLLHLVKTGPHRLRDLATYACVDPSTASRQVDHLVRLSLVERRPDPDDGRASLLAATEGGRAGARRMRDHRDAFLADVLGRWDDADLKTFTTLLTRFNDDLTGIAQTGTGTPPQARATIEEPA